MPHTISESRIQYFPAVRIEAWLCSLREIIYFFANFFAKKLCGLLTSLSKQYSDVNN